MGQIKRQSHQRGNLRALATVVCCAVLAGCGSLANLQQKNAKKKQEEALKKLVQASANEATRRLGPNALGEIHYVDEESGFILMRALSGRRIPVGLQMLGRGADGKTVSLSASSASRPPFVAADILSGTAVVGMTIIADPSAKAKPPSTETITEEDLPPLQTPEPLPGMEPPKEIEPLEETGGIPLEEDLPPLPSDPIPDPTLPIEPP